MRGALAYVLFASPLLAQPTRPVPQQSPIDALIQSYQSADSNGRYEEAAATRDQARALLAQIPADDPQFANWAERVSQTYENGGLATQARDVLEQALTRAGSSARVTLLDALSRSWEQDRNLLKAVSYLEQAVAAAESEAEPPRAAQSVAASGWFSATTGVSASRPYRAVVFLNGLPVASNALLYQRLFSLYQRLGRPEDAEAVLARIRTHVKNSDLMLASLYRQAGRVDEAAALYKRQAEQAADPQQAASVLQQLASLYEGAGRMSDAIGVTQQAIGKMEASDAPGADSRSAQIRQSLAFLLQQTGQIAAADAIYEQLMGSQTKEQVSVVDAYANYLAQTKRGDRAEALLKDYQDSHPDAQPWEQSNLLINLANVERMSGKPELAEEYQRRAQASQPPPPPAAVGETRIAETFMQAIKMVNSGKLDEGFNLAVQALDSAPAAADRESAEGLGSSVAESLAARKAPAKSDEIYRRVLALTESWSTATVTPLLFAQRSYAQCLASQQRWGEFEQAVERYQATLLGARGSETGYREDVLRLRTEVAYRPRKASGWAAGIAATGQAR